MKELNLIKLTIKFPFELTPVERQWFLDRIKTYATKLRDQMIEFRSMDIHMPDRF